MAVQLQITLPIHWASDFDTVAERWYFIHRPTGFCQYLLPKTGDEVTRAAELVPRLPPRPLLVESQGNAVEGLEIGRVKEKGGVEVVVREIGNVQVPVDGLIVQRGIEIPQQNQQAQVEGRNVMQQNLQAAPTGTFGRKASGAVARKPLARKALPGQNASQQQQVPVLQRQDSQIIPKSSVSKPVATETMVQQVQTQQQAVMSPRSSISQTSITESPLEHTNQLPMMTNIPVIQSPSQQPSGTTQAPIQSQTQHTTVTAQDPVHSPTQALDCEKIAPGSQSAPVDNPAVFWSEGFTEPPRSPASSQQWSSRPKLANRLSTSAIKMPKKAFEASKDYIKAHPGRTTAIAGGVIGGIGVAAEFCGVDGLSDAVAASKIYLNVKRAQQRKRISSVPLATTHETSPVVAQTETSAAAAAGPSAKDVALELFKMMQQQNQMASQNSAQPSTIPQYTTQAAVTNAQAPVQQYLPPQFVQPQYVILPQQVPVQPDLSSTTMQFTQPQYIVPQQQTPLQPDLSSTSFFVPPLQINQVQPTPDPSVAEYQPLPSPAQYPTPPASFSDPTSPLPIFDPSSMPILPDASTLAYTQLLQDQTTALMANQATLNSQAFTTTLTGQDMFVSVPTDLVGDCVVDPLQVESSTVEIETTSSWDILGDCAGDGILDYDSC